MSDISRKRPVTKRKSPAARLRRLVRKLTAGSPAEAARGALERTGEDKVFEHLWRAAAAASDYRRKLSIDQPNVLLFQMGKVASLALESALVDHGVNCFHTHFLGYEREASRLSRLFQGELNMRAAAIDLKLLARHTALNMLTRWYRANQVAPDRRLKVITLTRDPVTWYVSQLLQKVAFDPHPLTAWHRAFIKGSAASDDVGAAARELLRQVARLIVETRPAADLAAAHARGTALAMAMEPPQPFVADYFRRALIPLDWFDQEFKPAFDLDIRRAPELAAHGLAHRDLGFADVLIVRFEDLAIHMDAIARFVGLTSLALPRRNVTAGKPNASQILEAVRSFAATELGIAFQRELRTSPYGRACGYDKSVGI